MATYVIRTNIRCEEKAERNLRRAGFSTYSPMARIERFNKRRKVWVETELRLMPRYLFVEMEGQVPWYTLRACEGVESVLGWQGRPAKLNSTDAKVLAEVKDAEADLQFDTTRAAKVRRGEIGKTKRDTVRMRFPAGASIRITDGPFAQFIGQVTNVTAKGKLQALVMIFGHLSPVEIPAKWAELDEVGEAA
jgi:transcriptional antiterminator NusG